MTERTDSSLQTPVLQPPHVGGLMPLPPLSQSPVSLAPVSPDVYAFQDFRAYLTAWFQWKKQVQPHYSGAIFAKKAGFNSHTLLGMVIRGQRNLSATSIRAFCRALGLKGKEGDLLREARALQSGAQPRMTRPTTSSSSCSCPRPKARRRSCGRAATLLT